MTEGEREKGNLAGNRKRKKRGPHTDFLFLEEKKKKKRHGDREREREEGGKERKKERRENIFPSM